MEHLEIAAAVLAKCAAYDPWFPHPTDEIIAAWAEALEAQKVDRATALVAVTVMYANQRATSGYKPLPRDLIDAVKAVRVEAALGDEQARQRRIEAASDAKAAPDLPDYPRDWTSNQRTKAHFFALRKGIYPRHTEDWLRVQQAQNQADRNRERDMQRIGDTLQPEAARWIPRWTDDVVF